MKIVINNYQIERVLDNENNHVEPESLQGTLYWNIYYSVEALLYNHVKRYDTEKNQYYDYYPYRKRYIMHYGSSCFTINMDIDLDMLKGMVT